MDRFVLPHCYTCAQFAGLDTIQLLIHSGLSSEQNSRCKVFVIRFVLNQQYDLMVHTFLWP